MYKINKNNKGESEIIYNDKVYGKWNDNANIDYPEDLTLERDLSYLIQIGIELGKQMERDKKKAVTK